MLGLIYLIISILLGYILISTFYREVLKIDNLESLSGNLAKVSNWLFVLPASFIAGTAFLTFFTYFCAYYLRFKPNPLSIANAITMTLATLLICIYFFRNRHSIFIKSSGGFIKRHKLELSLITISALFYIFLDFYTFYLSGQKLNVGVSVFSDFGPHISLIRSFSFGNNFPTQYPHFPDGTIRYHFMFQFLAGNLEYLGLPLDYAFNIPSILSLVAMTMLLYSFASIITGRKWVGMLTCLFFFFRSSYAFYSYIGDLTKTPINSFWDFVVKIFNTDTFIGKTAHEDWGLFAQNVYANQRHFAFGLSVMLIMLISFYPLYLKMIKALPTFLKSKDNTYLKELVFSGSAWLFDNPYRAIFTGVLMGVCGFFNGAVLLASLTILFFLALFSKHKLEHLITAIISFSIFYLELKFFAGMTPTQDDGFIKVGFLAAIPQKIDYAIYSLMYNDKHYFSAFIESFKALPYIIDYYMSLLGILPLVVICAMFFSPKGVRYLIFTFFTPILMATFLKLTPDIAVNHKYVMIATILLNIFVASFVLKVFDNKPIRVLSFVLIFVLISSGVVDLITYYNKNKNPIVYDMDDQFLKWTLENTNGKDIFLSHFHTLNPILCAGRPIFYGWPYYAWSAGYNTDERQKIFKDICASTTKEDLIRKLKANNIKYVYIDPDFKNNDDYKVNRELFLQSLNTVISKDANDPTWAKAILEVK